MEKVYSYLRNHQPKLCVFSTATREGIPSSAVVAYAVADNGMLIFATNVGTHKWSNLSMNPYASFVAGWDFSQPNVQSRGKAFIVHDPEEISYYRNVFYSENPFAKRFENEKTIFITFQPEWLRFTDLTVKPMHVEEHTQKTVRLHKRQSKIESTALPFSGN
jgi:hypothetical protein